jgi:hypothetical protein
MKAMFLRLGLVVCVMLMGLVGTTALAQDETPPAPVLGAVNIIVPDLWVTPAEGGDEALLNEASSLDPGESLRSDETGVALITWFYDGTESALGPDSSLKLNAFSGEAREAFVLDAELTNGHLVTGVGNAVAEGVGGGQMTITTPRSGSPAARRVRAVGNGRGRNNLDRDSGQVEVQVGDADPVAVEEINSWSARPAQHQRSATTVLRLISAACAPLLPDEPQRPSGSSEESRRLGGIETGQVFWVRSATEGNLWLQVYFQTEPEDEEGRNFGWIYGPAVDLDPDACATLIRSALDGRLFGGLGVDQGLGDEAETEPLGS